MAGADGVVTRWSLAGATPLLQVRHDDQAVWGAAPLAGGGVLTWGADGSLRRWDATGRPRARHDADAGIYRAAVSPDGTAVVFAARDDSAWICPVDTLAPVRRLGPDAGFLSTVWELTTSADGRLVALSDDNNTRLGAFDEHHTLTVVDLPTPAGRIVLGTNAGYGLLTLCPFGHGDLLLDRIDPSASVWLPQPHDGVHHHPLAVSRRDGTLWAATTTAADLLLWQQPQRSG